MTPPDAPSPTPTVEGRRSPVESESQQGAPATAKALSNFPGAKRKRKAKQPPPRGAAELVLQGEVLPPKRRVNVSDLGIGRPTLCTPELWTKVVPDLELGLRPEPVLQALGVSYSVYRDWLDRGRRGEEPYRTFAEVVATATAAGETKLAKVWLNGDEAGVTWGPSRCAKEYLAATHRAYGDKVRIQVETELTELLSIFERHCRQAGREDIFSLALQDLADRDRA